MSLALAPAAHATAIYRYSIMGAFVRVEIELAGPLAPNLSAVDITSAIQSWSMSAWGSSLADPDVDTIYRTGPDDPNLYAFHVRVSTGDASGTAGISAWSIEIATVVPPSWPLVFCSAGVGSGTSLGQFPGGVCEAEFGRGDYTKLRTPLQYWPQLLRGDWTRVIVIPEPGTALLVMTGLAGLAALRLWRARAAARAG